MAFSLLGMVCLIGLKPLQAQDDSPPITFTPDAMRSYTDTQLTDFLNLLAETPTVDPTNLPRNAVAFYSLQRPEFPPFPADMWGNPAWNLGDGRYLLSDLDNDYGGIGGMHMMGLTPPDPGDGTNGYGGGGYSDSGLGGPVIFNTNELWLQITGESPDRTLSFLTIHPQWNDTNGVWDLFGTTNLAFSVGGLNLTNWLWVLRTGLWQTNNFALTNFSTTDQSYFRLGTMLDSDGDGLTDAYENLVSHTDLNNWDTDGDGISDGDEVALGLNPLSNELSQSGKWSNFTYDHAGQLQSISGVRTETVGADAQGNVNKNSQ